MVERMIGHMRSCEPRSIGMTVPTTPPIPIQIQSKSFATKLARAEQGKQCEAHNTNDYDKRKNAIWVDVDFFWSAFFGFFDCFLHELEYSTSAMKPGTMRSTYGYICGAL